MSSAVVPSAPPSAYRIRPTLGTLLLLGTAIVATVFVWQGITTKGAPDPTLPHTSRAVASLDIGVLVFREGLECILLLSAIMASMVRPNSCQRKPVPVRGAGGFLSTLLSSSFPVSLL